MLPTFSEFLAAGICALALLHPAAWAGPQQPAPQTSAEPGVARAPLPPPGFLRTCLKMIEQGRYDDARRLLEPVVADHPGWARAHFYLALTYHKQNRYVPARELYERVLELDPAYVNVRPFFGWCLYYLGELQASREMFEAFLAVRPDYPDAIFALGLIDYDADDLDAAGARFTQAIRLAVEGKDPATESKARARMADVHVRAGALGRARDELQRSIELNPDNYETFFKLSRVLDRLGDSAGAELARQRHAEARERARPVAAQRSPEKTP